MLRQEGPGADTEALAAREARRVAHAVPGTGEALYARAQGGRRDNEQAAREGEARARQVTREEWRTPEELDERARAQAARRVAKEEEAAMAARH